MINDCWLHNTTGVRDDGCRFIFHALKDNYSLQSLHLAGNNISELGGRYFSDAFFMMNDTLTCLNLDNNALGPTGCQYISDVLKTNDSIKELFLAQNSVLDEGAGYLAAALTTNVTLQKLSLDGNHLTEEGKRELAYSLHLNPDLNILMKL